MENIGLLSSIKINSSEKNSGLSGAERAFLEADLEHNENTYFEPIRQICVN